LPKATAQVPVEPVHERLKLMIEQVETWLQGNLSSWRSRPLPSVFPLLTGSERIDE
jgi:hypothetical protein